MGKSFVRSRIKPLSCPIEWCLVSVLAPSSLGNYNIPFEMLGHCLKGRTKEDAFDSNSLSSSSRFLHKLSMDALKTSGDVIPFS